MPDVQLTLQQYVNEHNLSKKELKEYLELVLDSLSYGSRTLHNDMGNNNSMSMCMLRQLKGMVNALGKKERKQALAERAGNPGTIFLSCDIYLLYGYSLGIITQQQLLDYDEEIRLAGEKSQSLPEQARMNILKSDEAYRYNALKVLKDCRQLLSATTPGIENASLENVIMYTRMHPKVLRPEHLADLVFACKVLNITS